MAPPYDSPTQPDMSSLLQPYQSEAEKMFPTNPMAGLSQKFATSHPLVSGILGNLLLAGSQAGTGRTLGESIGIASRMALAPEQYKTGQLQHQQQFEMGMANQAYQRQQQQRVFDMQSELHRAQIANFQSEEIYRQGEIEAKKRAKTAGQMHFDTKGQPWQEMTDAKGGVDLVNPLTHQSAYDLPADQRPTMDPTAGKREPNSPPVNAGSLAMSQFLDKHGHPPLTPAEHNEINENFVRLSSQVAGGKTGATDIAGQPKRTAEALIGEARATATKDIEPPAWAPDKAWDYYMTHTTQFKSPEEAAADLDKQHTDYRAKLAKANDSVAKFTASGAANKGIDYNTWKQQQAAGPTKGGPKAKPKGLWNALRGVYE